MTSPRLTVNGIGRPPADGVTANPAINRRSGRSFSFIGASTFLLTTAPPPPWQEVIGNIACCGPSKHCVSCDLRVGSQQIAAAKPDDSLAGIEYVFNLIKRTSHQIS
jgi:hypothetical protein